MRSRLMVGRLKVGRFRILIVGLLAALVMAACSLNSEDNSSNTNTVKSAPADDGAQVIKSDSDHRQYRSIELPNKLRVLLISDPNTDKAAASLDVHTGSAQDPKDYQGLAHFLEHMLFLGTKKYPKAGEYQSFITAHGGSHNAYTSFEHTNYFFDIDADYLEPTLDRFSQFFIAPLFTESYVDREKNAVHSEYMSKIKNDQRKALDVFKQVINPQHPFAKFSVGNLDTLSVTGSEHLRDQLLRFYADYYSASLMTLVVIGKEPLADLESMVVQRFSAIANSNKQVSDIEEPLFADGALPLMLQIQPEKEQRTLSIAFPTEQEINFYRQKPLHYLGNIIGHEGKGSLLSYLKKRGWVEGLSAGAGLSYAGGASFNISIKLTAEGVENVDNIVVAVFQTVNRIAEPVERQRLFNEQKALAEQQFRYQEMSTPMRYAMSLASNLHYYPLQDVLRGSYLMDQYDEPLIERFLADLSPDNAIVTLNAPGVRVDQKTHFYGTEYSVAPVAKQQLSRWKAAGLNSEITLPEANIFIADNLDLKPFDKPLEDKPSVETDSENSSPQLLSGDLLSKKQGIRLWFKRDETFRLPKGSLLFSVRSPVASDSAQHSALLNMFTSIVADELNELSYPATLAGLNYSLKAHGRGFSAKINGFTDKQGLLLDEILKALKSPQFDAKRFENIKLELIRRLENVSKQQPYRRALDGLPELLYRHQWSDQQLLAAYKAMTLQQLRDFKQTLLASSSIDMLVHGNYLQAEARTFANNVAATLLKRSVAPASIEVVKLQQGDWSQPVASDYSDAMVMLYLQATDTDKKRRAAMGVTAQILRSDFYTQLRTEKQLGYIVTAGAYPAMDVPGIFFLVQSPVAGPVALKQEVENYLAQQVEVAATMTDELFDRHRKALILQLSESPKNMWEQSEQYWQDIAHSYYDFDSRHQLITAMESLTLAQWQQYFEQDVVGGQRRAIWLYATGKFTDQPDLKVSPIKNVSTFKSAQEYYPFL